MIVLGIETSCDETSVSIVEKKVSNNFGRILSEQTLSQISKHKKFGGVVPELASREHSKNLDFLVKESIKDSKVNLEQITAFAATSGPGLLGSLLVGTNYAKALAITTNKPFLAINHLQGHVLVSRLYKKIEFPFMCLLVSGGHTQILLARNYNKFKVIGETLDDAVGEVFDKTAKILGLHYPGGPMIEKLANKSRGKYKFNLPKPLMSKKTFNLSFSGLKTAVRRIVESGINKTQSYDLAFEFQSVISDCLLSKVKLSFDHLRKKNSINDLVLTGGVASNSFIRNKFESFCNKEKLSFFVPERNLCVDNATMIAWAGLEMIKNGKQNSEITHKADPRWRIDKL